MTNARRRLEDLEATLRRFSLTEACQKCGAPHRVRRSRLWLVVAKEVPRCSDCNRVVDPSDEDRPIQTEKLIHLVDGTGV